MANGVIEEEKAGRSNTLRATTKDSSRAGIYNDIQAASHPVLPSNAIITYMDEGAANVVYSLSVPHPFEESTSSCWDASPNSQNRRDGFGFWDGKSPFIHPVMSRFHFIQSSESLMAFVFILLSSDIAVTPFSERNNI
jgi:hypothetical protein